MARRLPEQRVDEEAKALLYSFLWTRDVGLNLQFVEPDALIIIHMLSAVWSEGSNHHDFSSNSLFSHES